MLTVVVEFQTDEDRKLSLNSAVSALDNKRVIVKTLSEFAGWYANSLAIRRDRHHDSANLFHLP